MLEGVGVAAASNSASLAAARPTPVVAPTGIVTLSGTRVETPTTSPVAASAEDGGLSVGAKAGIGVGAALGGVLVIAIVVLAFLLGRRHRNRATGEPGGGQAYASVTQHGSSPTTVRSPGSATVVGSESGGGGGSGRRSRSRGFVAFFLPWRRRAEYGHEEKWELGQGQGARSELGKKGGGEDVVARMEKGRDTPDRERSREGVLESG